FRSTCMEEMPLAPIDSVLAANVAKVGESLRFGLNVDDINVDRYLPPAAEGEEAPADEGSLDEVDLPLDALRTLEASGRLAFGQAKFTGMTLTDASFTL